MIRCPDCQQANPETARHCSRCGAALKPATAEAFWRLNDWLDLKAMMAALLAALGVLCVRVLVHWYLMPWQGARHEWRLMVFHGSLGLASGLAVALIKKDEGRVLRWAALGLIGGALSWLFDFTYLANHMLSQAVFYVVNWYSPDQAILWSFGLLQVLRLLGISLVLGLAAAWNQRRALQFRVAIFVALALVLRFWFKGFTLSSDNIWLYPGHLGLYVGSLLSLFYGLAFLDSNSAK